MSKLTEAELEWCRYLSSLGVSYRRISQQLGGKISPMGVWYNLNRKGKAFTSRKSTEPTLEGEDPPKLELVRDEIQEIQDHEPSNSLNWSKGLGTELHQVVRIRAVRNSCGGTKDVGVRERILNQFINRRDADPRLRRLLELGSRTLKQLGLENEPFLGNALGNLLRKLYKAHYARRRRYINYKRTVHSAVAYLTQWHLTYQAKIKPHLKIDKKTLRDIRKLTKIPAQKV